MDDKYHALAKGLQVDALKGGPFLAIWIWLASVSWYSLFTLLGAIVGFLYGVVLLYDKLAQMDLVPPAKRLFKKAAKAAIPATPPADGGGT